MTSRLVVAAALALGLAGGAGCVWYLRPQCDDLIKNGQETDVDCGGACAPCALGRSCRSGWDCESGTCEGGTCVPKPCENGVRDGLETDKDCGGGVCHRCAGARHCAQNSDCFGGDCDPVTSTCASLRTIAFAPNERYGAGYKSYVMAAGYLDAGTVLDLVVANEEEDSVTVFLGNGDGTFHKASATNFQVHSPACGSLPPAEGANCGYPTGVALADMDRDGHTDVLTANYHGDSVAVLRGVGDGTLHPAATYATEPGAETSNLAVGDLSGDGFPDVVAANPATGDASLFLGGAGGVLGTATPLTVNGGHGTPFSVAMGDFDGDGHLDVAIADLRAHVVSVRLGKGDGTLGPERLYAEGGDGAVICTAADVNVDGKLDVVCANRGSSDTGPGSVSVLLGRGDGTFELPRLSTTGPATGPYAVAVADFNRDGVPDVVTPNFRTGTASVLLGVGDGTFDPPIDVGTVGDYTYGVATGDFNGDGLPDFAVCNANSNDMVVKLNASY